MVICIIAIIVFGFLGIFSAKYRTYAKESLRCVARMATLRPCESNFDQKVKSKIVSGLMKRHEGMAKFVFKHFVILSWIFTIAMIASIILVVIGIYNFLIYGSCDPNGGVCIYKEISDSVTAKNCTIP